MLTIFDILQKLGIAILNQAAQDYRRGADGMEAFFADGSFDEIARIYGVPASVAEGIRRQVAGGRRMYNSLKRGGDSS